MCAGEWSGGRIQTRGGRRQTERTTENSNRHLNMMDCRTGLLLLLLAAGSCVKCEQLTQPASVTVQPGQRLTISCQVSYDVSDYWTAWIRQPAGKELEWISSDEIIKYSLNDTFSVDLDSSSNTVTLNGQNMQPEDSAVYYCARATVTQTSEQLNKNPSKSEQL
ncbi:Ig heavy chain V region 441 isoform X2 [Nothobranchius furzeri]|uniref:Ig heavy chain V region 441 isoform X2 n=1 Tax=Nothobranchius furzeri TaxID=105023 RepID=UPI00390498EA